jgi:hypothetical protein
VEAPQIKGHAEETPLIAAIGDGDAQIVMDSTEAVNKHSEKNYNVLWA